MDTFYKTGKTAGRGDGASGASEATAPASSFNEWALVELFGHNKIVGKVSETTLAGGAFLRVDVPGFDAQAAFTRFYSPGSIYSISPITEEIARGMMERYRNEPVSRFELPQIAEKVERDFEGG